jgi:hypothetical protein
MNETADPAAAPPNAGLPRPRLGDKLAVALQGLRAGAAPLLRVDDKGNAALLPYQFDAASGRLHRRGCREIPRHAALYGLSHVSRDQLANSCKWCHPVPDDQKSPPDTTDRTELLFGLVSLVGQFTSVLRERGKEFQQTTEGQRLAGQFGAAYRSLDTGQKAVLDLVVNVLDQLVDRTRRLDDSLHQSREDVPGPAPEGEV